LKPLCTDARTISVRHRGKDTNIFGLKAFQ
jgi:hypothetical protein